VAKSICDLAAGDHACLVCASDDERWGLVSEYLRGGLERGERTIYITAEHSEEEVRQALSPEANADELTVVPASVAHGYGAGGGFDYVERLGVWTGHAHAAVADGFSGLRVAVDMTWVDEVDLSLEQLVDYERWGTHLLRASPGTALCIYDQRRFHSHTLARAGHAHAVRLGTAAARSPVFQSQLLTVSRSGPGAVVISGEVDAANVSALAHALESVVDAQDALLMDLRELEFIDAAGLRAIHDMARRLHARGGELVLLSPPAVVGRMLPVLGVDDMMTLDSEELGP
jgi:anti-anti-sigma factor